MTAFTNALSTVFLVAAAVAAAAFALSWLIKQRPLRESVAAGNSVGEGFAMPRHIDSLAEASRALTTLVGPDGRRQLVERLGERAGVTLAAAASWLIVRLHEDPGADIVLPCRDFELPAEAGERALAELAAAGMVSVDPAPGSGAAGGSDRHRVGRGRRSGA